MVCWNHIVWRFWLKSQPFAISWSLDHCSFSVTFEVCHCIRFNRWYRPTYSLNWRSASSLFLFAFFSFGTRSITSCCLDDFLISLKLKLHTLPIWYQILPKVKWRGLLYMPLQIIIIILIIWVILILSIWWSTLWPRFRPELFNFIFDLFASINNTI